MSYIPRNIEDLAMPAALNFSHGFEDTKCWDKKYVVNEDTGEYLGIVGHKFNCASHPDFYQRTWEAMTQVLPDHELDGARVTWNSAKWGAWSSMQVILPNSKYTIETDKQSTEVAQRIICFHGIDGSCSNQVYFGAIDFFCTNGMISGQYDKIKRKNTTNFNLDKFVKELEQKNVVFAEQMGKVQRMAETSLVGKYEQVEEVLKALMPERPAEKMLDLYNEEVISRGDNVFALYSAMTNYASYADDRNGFKMRASDNDNAPLTMWNREQTVSKWVSSPAFETLLSAAA
jgi:hypothetical protein